MKRFLTNILRICSFSISNMLVCINILNEEVQAPLQSSSVQCKIYAPMKQTTSSPATYSLCVAERDRRSPDQSPEDHQEEAGSSSKRPQPYPHGFWSDAVVCEESTSCLKANEELNKPSRVWRWRIWRAYGLQTVLEPNRRTWSSGLVENQ